jgi:hypothetical protein
VIAPIIRIAAIAPTSRVRAPVAAWTAQPPLFVVLVTTHAFTVVSQTAGVRHSLESAQLVAHLPSAPHAYGVHCVTVPFFAVDDV